jgi:ADP-ribosyl-[dinitrogen reductase] hydrolase
MRLAPVPMFFAADMAKAVHYSAESSRTTHAAAECLDACRLFGAMLVRALNGFAREEVLLGDARTFSGSPAVEAIARGDYRAKGETAISGSGYVVKSLEAALWCFDQTESYEQAVLRAANLGDDADTTAAVCGQIAGAFYGVTGIPQRWLGTLAMRGEIDALASKLFAHSGLASA